MVGEYIKGFAIAENFTVTGSYEELGTKYHETAL